MTFRGEQPRLWPGSSPRAGRHTPPARRPRFVADAQPLVLAHLARFGPTSGEQLTLAVKAAGVVPHDDRAFGSVYSSLSRRGDIVAVGTARRLRGHGTPGGTVWDVRPSRPPQRRRR